MQIFQCLKTQVDNSEWSPFESPRSTQRGCVGVRHYLRFAKDLSNWRCIWETTHSPLPVFRCFLLAHLVGTGGSIFQSWLFWAFLLKFRGVPVFLFPKLYSIPRRNVDQMSDSFVGLLASINLILNGYLRACCLKNMGRSWLSCRRKTRTIRTRTNTR